MQQLLDMNVFAKTRSKSKVPVSLWPLCLFVLELGFAYKTAVLKDSSKAPAQYLFSTKNTLVIKFSFPSSFIFLKPLPQVQKRQVPYQFLLVSVPGVTYSRSGLIRSCAVYLAEGCPCGWKCSLLDGATVQLCISFLMRSLGVQCLSLIRSSQNRTCYFLLITLYNSVIHKDSS